MNHCEFIVYEQTNFLQRAPAFPASKVETEIRRMSRPIRNDVRQLHERATVGFCALEIHRHLKGKYSNEERHTYMCVRARDDVSLSLSLSLHLNFFLEPRGTDATPIWD